MSSYIMQFGLSKKALAVGPRIIIGRPRLVMAHMQECATFGLVSLTGVQDDSPVLEAFPIPGCLDQAFSGLRLY